MLKNTLYKFMNKFNNDLEYNIDFMVKTKESIIICGWIFSKKHENIEVSTSRYCDYSFITDYRMDVNTNFELPKDLKTGFELNLNYEGNFKNFTLTFSDGKSKIHMLINEKTIEQFKRNVSLDEWKEKHCITDEEKEFQKNYKFDYSPKISIILPTYNTKIRYLEDLFNSIIGQTYKNWELCIADGSSDKNTIEYLKSISHKNIIIKFLEENKGITENTIEAHKLCKGDYVLLIDHDDYLSYDALFEVVKAINSKDNVDFVFSDRIVIDDNNNYIVHTALLPEFNHDYLLTCNFLCHLSVFSSKVIEKSGFLRLGYNGAQDYEFTLRFLSHAEESVHIAKVLYFWRAADTSIARNSSNKTYVDDVGKRILDEHTKKIGYPAKVESLMNGVYRLKYKIKKDYSVAVLIMDKGNSKNLKECVKSVKEKASYENYHIYIISDSNNKSCKSAEYFKVHESENINILEYTKEEKGTSILKNWAIENIDADYILMLDSDTKIASHNFITEMLMYAQRDDVGAVGAKIFDKNEKIIDCGIDIGYEGKIAYNFEHEKGYFSEGNMLRLETVRNYSAVSGRCMMFSKSDYDKAGGFDIHHFNENLYDLDICLKFRELGRLNIYTPYCEIYYLESPLNIIDDAKENYIFKQKWEKYFIEGDPYINKLW